MNEIVILPSFEKGAKRLVKKYKSLSSELVEFIRLSEKEGIQGLHLGNGIYKARISVKSKSKGKSGGLRIISFAELLISVQDKTVFLVAIYDKSEVSSVNKGEIDKILKTYDLH